MFNLSYRIAGVCRSHLPKESVTSLGFILSMIVIFLFTTLYTFFYAMGPCPTYLYPVLLRSQYLSYSSLTHFFTQILLKFCEMRQSINQSITFNENTFVTVCPPEPSSLPFSHRWVLWQFQNHLFSKHTYQGGTHIWLMLTDEDILFSSPFNKDFFPRHLFIEAKVFLFTSFTFNVQVQIPIWDVLVSPHL